MGGLCFGCISTTDEPRLWENDTAPCPHLLPRTLSSKIFTEGGMKRRTGHCVSSFLLSWYWCVPTPKKNLNLRHLYCLKTSMSSPFKHSKGLNFFVLTKITYLYFDKLILNINLVILIWRTLCKLLKPFLFL